MKILLTTLNAKYVHSNLALRYLFSVANGRKNIEMREFTINNDMGYIYNEIIRGGYDMVCFSCYIWNIEKTREIASWVKKAMPKALIVLGGPEVSYECEDFLRENLWCDYIVRGEGEVPFEYIFNKIDAGQGFDDCPSLAYLRRDTLDTSKPEAACGVSKLDGCETSKSYAGVDMREKLSLQYVENPMAVPLDMDMVPFPYEAGKIESDKVVYYESSRGCPYRCSYCLSSIEKSIRARSLEKTLDELDFFLGEKVKQVKFIDRTFNFDRNRAFSIWKHLIEHDNGVTNFHFEICAELMSEEIFQLLGQARKGLFQFEIGIQSTNEQALAGVNRHNDLDKIRENVMRLVALGNSHVHVDLIAGLPYEGFDSFRRSFDEVYSLGADNLQLGFLKLLKGTAIRDGIAPFNPVQGDESSGERNCGIAKVDHGYVYRDKAPYEIIANKYISPVELMKLKMVETVLELYDNKEGFACSIRLLIEKYGQGAFGFFMSLGDFFYDEGFQNRSHKKEDLYRILYKYVCSQKNFDEDFAQEAKACIYRDLEASMNFDAVKKFNKKGWDVR